MAQNAQAQSLSTEEIQKMLEDNYVFIKAIVDQQNLGRLQQMQEYQAKLQQNLMQLAAVADAHPPSAAPGPAPAGQAPAPAPAPAPPMAAPQQQQRPAGMGVPPANTVPGQGQAPTLFLGGGLPPGQQFNMFGQGQ